MMDVYNGVHGQLLLVLPLTLIFQMSIANEVFVYSPVNLTTQVSALSKLFSVMLLQMYGPCCSKPELCFKLPPLP